MAHSEHSNRQILFLPYFHLSFISFFSLLKMKSWSIFTNYIYNDQLPDTLILYLLYFIYGISKVRYNILKIQQFDANLIFFQMWRLRLRKANKCIQSLFIYYLKEFNHTFSTITKKKKKMFEYIIWVIILTLQLFYACLKECHSLDTMQHWVFSLYLSGPKLATNWKRHGWRAIKGRKQTYLCIIM